MQALLSHKDSSWKFWKKSRDSIPPPTQSSRPMIPISPPSPAMEASHSSSTTPSDVVVGLNPLFGNSKLPRIRGTSAPYPLSGQSGTMKHHRKSSLPQLHEEKPEEKPDENLEKKDSERLTTTISVGVE
eukprot:TRINITY_DN10322_c0_g1_i1.p2 TRINITY_DN10322_c0_g1~~TRINITY_DN10322_c0_g1_i1.p2  ORF type:complete len:129 (-),score=25.81 TRINITY_DN10322_c0_g1_i1:246-632(-)